MMTVQHVGKWYLTHDMIFYEFPKQYWLNEWLKQNKTKQNKTKKFMACEEENDVFNMNCVRNARKKVKLFFCKFPSLMLILDFLDSNLDNNRITNLMKINRMW